MAREILSPASEDETLTAVEQNHDSDSDSSSAPDASGVVMIEATEKGSGKKIIVSYNFGTSLADAVEKFGEDVVLSGFRRTSVITAQGIMRRLAKAGKSDAEIQDAITAWKPGVAMERVMDPVATLKARIANMTPEERAKILAELQAV